MAVEGKQVLQKKVKPAAKVLPKKVKPAAKVLQKKVNPAAKVLQKMKSAMKVKVLQKVKGAMKAKVLQKAKGAMKVKVLQKAKGPKGAMKVMKKPLVQKKRKVNAKPSSMPSRSSKPSGSARPSTASRPTSSAPVPNGDGGHAGEVVVNKEGEQVQMPGEGNRLLFGNRLRSGGSGGGSSWEFQVVNYLMAEEWVRVQISRAYERWSSQNPNRIVLPQYFAVSWLVEKIRLGHFDAYLDLVGMQPEEVD